MKKLWLDLELRADIDDYITLIMALEMKEADIKYISIHNPSVQELKLLKNTILKYYDLKIIEKQPIIAISGIITEYPEDKDINKSLYKLADEYHKDSDKIDVWNIEDIIDNTSNKNLKELTYFTGGSLYTLSMIMKREPELVAYIQGGYAGCNIVENKDTLEKFYDKESVPSWNVNLDLDATQAVLDNKKAQLNFISKNICHASIISLEDIGNRHSLGVDVLINYYDGKPKKMTYKAMHDVLAFITIFNTDIVEFKKVELTGHKRKKRMYWRSYLNENSNVKISVSFNYDKFKEFFFTSLKIT